MSWISLRCPPGGLQAVADLIHLDRQMYGTQNDPINMALRRYAGMALTNLTFGDVVNKVGATGAPRPHASSAKANTSLRRGPNWTPRLVRHVPECPLTTKAARASVVVVVVSPFLTHCHPFSIASHRPLCARERVACKLWLPS